MNVEELGGVLRLCMPCMKPRAQSLPGATPLSSSSDEAYHEHDKDPEMPSGPISSAFVPEPLRTTSKIGRNDLCPCGSGKKYKRCCGGATVELALGSDHADQISSMIRSASGPRSEIAPQTVAVSSPSHRSTR
jgi:SEC-C motif